MTIVGQEKPSLEDLAHFGVKGMKWGQHKERTPLEAVSGKANRRPTRAEILGARARQKERRAGISKLDKKYGKDPTTGKLFFSKEHERAYMALLEGDDRVISKYHTRGEKALATILFGPIGAVQTSNLRVKSRVANRRA